MEDWDDGKGWFNLTTKDLKEFATYLEKVKSKLTAIFQDLELKEGVLTAENIKNCYLGIDSSAGTFYLSERVAKWSFMIFALAGWAIR